MELWKIHRYCEGANLAELHQIEQRLEALIGSGKAKETNAEKALAIVREYIALKQLFGD